ncbi:hypothetical protein [Emticicia fluvialis]|uniref:hypothetical protein n=1 Tax=Emticicia fluvialis TaxID=2974474 RepID=UPI0021663DBF|nr:hypothetical protein [Emticicia fluvialis]
MRKTIFFALFICLSLSAAAQQGSSLVAPFEGLSSRLRLLPPNAAKTQEFGNVPINFSTGQLNYNLPIYQIQVDENLTIPIQLAYNNTGLKPQDVPTWVGNGWNLDVGGTIVQNVNGIPDFGTNGLQQPDIRSEMLNYLNGTVVEPTRYEYLNDVMNSVKDSQYDLFSFNFLGRSGKFYFHADSIILMNKMPVKIAYASNSFTITDEKGYLFAFTLRKANFGTFYEGTALNPNGTPTNMNSATWYLTKITSPNGVEVNFNYIEDITYQTYAPSVSFSTGAVADPDCRNKGSYDKSVTYTDTNIGQYLLDNITWKGKTVDFQFFSRNDLIDIVGTKAKGLSAILVYDEASLETNRIGFNYGYIGINDRLQLNSVSFIENKTPFAAVQTTSFEYFEKVGGDIPIPSLKTPSGFREPNNSVDHWGYYNGKYNPNSKVPDVDYSQITTTPLTTETLANRRADNTYSKIGMLKRINYPTKGYTEIYYEPNMVNFKTSAIPFFLQTQTPEAVVDDSSRFQIGGNRVSRIVDYTGTLKSNERIITYEQAKLWAEPYYISEIEVGKLSNSTGPCTSCGKKYIVSDNILYNWDGYQVEYRKVTETYGGTGENGKKVYEYISNFYAGDPIEVPPHAATVNLNWRSGNLKKEQTYERTGLTYTLAQESTNTYNTTPIYPITRYGFKAGRIMACDQQALSSSEVYNYFTHVRTPVFTDQYKLESTTTAEYSGGVALSNTVSYAYTSEMLQRATRTTNSKNKVDSTITYYANDYNNIAGTNIDQLKSKNIIGLPLKVIRKVDNYVIDGVMIKSDTKGNPIEIYRYENASLATHTHNKAQYILPQFKLLETRKYSSKGNPIEIQRLSQPPTTYVWAYKHSYPVVSVQNASVANVEAVIGSLETAADTYSAANVEALGTNLRSNLPAALVTSGVMKSGAGFSQITAPNGLKTNFEYDGTNRLSSIKDHRDYLTDHYRYFYATASEACTAPSAPTISTTATTLCSVTLTASGCSTGTVQWSNGATGTSISVGTTTTTSYTAKCKVATCESAASNAITLPGLPATWSAMDVGTHASAGCTQNSSGNLTMLGNGIVGSTSDTFHWIYKAFTGNVTIIAKINSIPGDDGDRSGIMIRSNLNANAKFYTLIQDGNANVGELKRDSDGATGGLYSYAPSAVNQTWIKVVKTGSTIKGYYSTNSNPEANNAWNDSFSLTGTAATTLDFGTNFYLGFALWGNANNTTFTNITINGVAL